MIIGGPGCAALLLSVAVFSTAQAVEFIKIDASRSGDRYTVELVLIADLPETFVRQVLEDPDRVVRVSPALVEAHHLPSVRTGVRRFRDRTRSCVWFYCVDYRNTLDMRILDNRDIQLTVDPQHSEFKYGVYTWRTEALDNERTRLTFHSVSTPGFWVPTISLLESRVRRDVEEMMRRMESNYRWNEQRINWGGKHPAYPDE